MKVESDDFCWAGGLEKLLKFLERGDFLDCRRCCHLGTRGGGKVQRRKRGVEWDERIVGINSDF